MRSGPLEIIVIIAIIIAVVVAARMFRPGGVFRWHRSAPSNTTEKPRPKKKEGARGYFTRLGVALGLVGIFLLMAGLSAFRWAVQSYTLSFVFIAVGVIIIIIIRRKR